MINAQSEKDHGIDEGEKYDEEDGDCLLYTSDAADE